MEIRSFSVRRALLISMGLILPMASLISCGNPRQGASGQPTDPAAQSRSANAPASTVSPDETASIRRAIEDHLRERAGLDMSQMDMNLDAIQINGEEAKAEASFRFKQGGSMAMTYTLSRAGNGWTVTKSEPAPGTQQAHPPMDQTHSEVAPGASDASSASDFTDFMNSHAAGNQK